MIDNSSGVLGDFILEEVTVFIFIGDLSLMIHELLFLLSFSVRLIENDTISFHRFESFDENLCVETRSFYIFINNSRSKQNKRNPRHPFVDIGR